MSEQVQVAPEGTSQDTSSRNQHLAAELRRFGTFDELLRSSFYREHRDELTGLLDAPRVHRAGEVTPRLRSFLRVVEWNIERGLRLDGIVEVLNAHPVLRFADLMLINEVDDGMLRSGNLNVARELGRALSAHAVFGAEYLELTKGAGDELRLAGENTRSLHGNAILTRHVFSSPHIIRLPRCENNFESKERRIGGRIAILIALEVGEASFVVGNTHFDVAGTPNCRSRQMRAMLQSIDNRLGGQKTRAALVGGDLNTHTFARGTKFRAMMNTALILNSHPDTLRRRLMHPEVKEPAIAELARFGYATECFNDRSATSRTIVSDLDDPARLPRPMKWWVARRVGPEGLLLEFRLDWMAARGLSALKAGEIIDDTTGIASVDAQTFPGLTHSGASISDHDPIVVDIALRPSS
ncbi:MAG: endonuclease/exonuclease/phosphatase family protein [Blastocatellia bacterium]